jgi:hypothetical protein
MAKHPDGEGLSEIAEPKNGWSPGHNTGLCLTKVLFYLETNCWLDVILIDLLLTCPPGYSSRVWSACEAHFLHLVEVCCVTSLEEPVSSSFACFQRCFSMSLVLEKDLCILLSGWTAFSSCLLRCLLLRMTSCLFYLRQLLFAFSSLYILFFFFFF